VDVTFETRAVRTYGVSSVFYAREMYHAVEAGVASAATLVTVWIKFLLGEDVAAGLVGEEVVSIAR
jgi:hypothetical protein